MKEQANRIRAGWVILVNGKRYNVIGIEILQPGKGGAFIQVEMRDVITGLKTKERWRTVDTVEKLDTEDKDFNFLYNEGESFIFMDAESFEQITIDKGLLGDKAFLLCENMPVVISFIEGEAVSVSLPKTVVCTIEETEAVVKGQTATSSFKPATIKGGVRIMIPQFIDAGTDVVISTDDLTYLERAKK